MSIIKKIVSLAVIAALCACGMALADEKAAFSADNYLGRWTDLNGIRHIDIQAREEGGGYIANVTMDFFDGENYGYDVWAYGCVYDSESHMLKSISRVTGVGRNNSNGEEEITGTDYDFSGAQFFFDEAGSLIWNDKTLGLDDGMVFRPEETGKEMPAEAAAFEGTWQCGRAAADINWEEEGFKVNITWGSSAWENTEWEYSCYFHGEDNTLVSMPFGTRTEYVYDDNGEPVSAKEVYSDGCAVFSLDTDGRLIWQDEKENAGEGMRFVKLSDEPTINGSIEDGSYILRVELPENETGEWTADDMSESDSAVKLNYTKLENGIFEARFDPITDGSAVVVLKHMKGIACEQAHTFDLLVKDGQVTEVTGGSFAASPTVSELAECFTGEWREQDTQFTQMTISADDEGVLTAEIISPVTHGAYLFRMTLHYDCLLDAFVYDDGAAYDLPITDSEEYIPGDPILKSLSGCLMLKTDESEQSVLIWHSLVTPDEPDKVFVFLGSKDANI